MTREEIFRSRCAYGVDILTYEERSSMGVDRFHEWVEEHIHPIPKSELVNGHEYKAVSGSIVWTCVWDGEVFKPSMRKWGTGPGKTLKHYEDSEDNAAAVPMRLS